MSIPPGASGRGCSAHLAQPVGEDGIREANQLVQILYDINGLDMVFRREDNEHDILHHVFRWDTRAPEHMFNHGFQAYPQGNTPDNIYYNLDDFVHNAGQPLIERNPNDTTYGFVSTSLNSGYFPQTHSFRNQVVYRYEIYAPGGIWVRETLPNYRHQYQNEVCFVRGIDRQYIRSAQRFRFVASDNSWHLGHERVNQTLLINHYIDPASHPTRRLLPIENPVDIYRIEIDNRIRNMPLDIEYVDDIEPMAMRRAKREVNDSAVWYAKEVCDIDSYINAGFRSCYSTEVYLFMRNEYVLVDYAPGTTNDKVLNGPHLICDGFPSLADTAFGEYGLDCSFGSHDLKEAYIFTSNLCARINFAPHSKDDFIIDGPMTIAQMFPFFEGTGFDQGVDAAFESSVKYETYIFKGDRYALIDYKQPRLIGEPKKITDGFNSLKGTIFESGIEAAFASHREEEIYIFKGDQYALINFAPGSTKDYIITGPNKITPYWPSMANLLPCKNHGLDVHDHRRSDAAHGHEGL